MPPHAASDKPEPARASAVRMFGRWQLLRLLGKSDRTMAWAVAQPGTDHELMLVLPRNQPIGSAPLDRWMQAVQRGARLNHPHLAPAAEIGVQDGWPYAAYDLQDAATLADRIPAQGLPGTEVAALALQALQGLAFAHEGGVAHHDLQTWHLLVDDRGGVRLVGLEVAAEALANDDSGLDPGTLRAQRSAAERDVLALGVVLHHTLAGQPALDQADTGRVIARLPPAGRDIVRLPWSTGQPVAEALRAIVNRSTDRQERQRYRNARTLGRALEGWLKAETDSQSGPLALLADRLRAAGVLPALPGAQAQASRLASMEKERTNELAEVVLQDPALGLDHRIMAPDPPRTVDDEHTILHPLDDPLADTALILEADTAQARQFLVGHQSLPEQAGKDGRREKTDRKESGLHDRCRLEIAQHRADDLPAQCDQCRQRRIKQDQSTATDQTRRGQRNQHQRADPAADSPTYIHQHAKRGDIGQHLQRKLHVEPFLPKDGRKQSGTDGKEIKHHRQQELERIREMEWSNPALGQQCSEQCEAAEQQTIQIEIPEGAPAGLPSGREPLAHGCCETFPA